LTSALAIASTQEPQNTYMIQTAGSVSTRSMSAVSTDGLFSI
jgi:hypothetical protein